MNKKEFAEMIIDTLVERQTFKKDELEIQEVYKNNGVELTGIAIKTNHSDVATCNVIIYVDDLTDESIDDIVKIFEKQKNANPFNGSIFKDIYHFDSLKKHIYPYVINAGNNKKLLSDTPHTKFLDLAIAYSIKYTLDNRTARVAISNNLLSHWGITVEELDNVAKANFQNEIDKVCIKNIQGVIQSILGSKSDKDDCESDKKDDCEIYVVSTADGIRGAVSMCFDEVLEKIEYILGTSEFYIIPSSIHEVLVLKSDRISPNYIKSMITGVNNNCVEKHEILSYNLYKYVKGKGVEIA